MTGDEIIKLAKGLAMFLEGFAEQMGVELDGTVASFKTEDGTTLLALDAGELVKKAKALRLGMIDSDE